MFLHQEQGIGKLADNCRYCRCRLIGTSLDYLAGMGSQKFFC